MRYVRNLARRPVRTLLTVLGITIGIWALVVFGSMANKINALVAGGSTYYADKITVSDGSGQLGGFASAPMSLSTADKIRAVDGRQGRRCVRDDADGRPGERGDHGHAADDHRQHPRRRPGARDVQAQLRRRAGADRRRTKARTWRWSAPTSPASSTSTSATRSTLKGVPFRVIGVLEPTLTAPDQAVSVPLDAAQKLLLTTLPPMIASKLNASDIATSMVVYPDPGQDIEALATRIKAEVPDISTMTGKDFDKQIGGATSILNSILVGIALISLLVGGLSVVNTMAMSIAERTREIGIKRAIGGSRTRIVRELVIEAALIGFIGGAIGLILGAIVVTLVNEAGRSSGTILFELTTGTAITAVAFSTILGALAGFVPALHAARLDPVTALRYE